MGQRNRSDVDETLVQQFSWHDYARLAQYIKPYRKPIYRILAVIIIANVAGMLGPYFTKIVIGNVIPARDVRQLLWIGALYTGSLILIGWCLRYRIYHITELGQDVLKDMRLDIFQHLQKLSFAYFDNRPHGKILIRVVNYINTLSDLLSNGLVNLISDVFNVVITLIFMFTINARLTWYSLVLIPFLALMVMVIQNRQRKAYQVLSNKQSNLNAYIHESIAGVKVTQSFAREDENFRIFDAINKDNKQSWMHAVKIQFLLWPGVQNISVITMCLIYFVEIRQIGVQVSTGTLIAFIGYINNFWNPIINIGNFYNSLITATAYLERIFETLDEPIEIMDAPNAYDLPQISGQVVFDHVNFRYEPGKNILNDVHFEVTQGQSIALVGPTGAGKTTIINLLSRFYDVSEGAVLIDGHDVREVTLASLRKQVGVMLQDSFIFTGTIMENIRYGKLDATDEEVVTAAKIVHADHFIKDLKNGYQTKVEERGNTLSAGQRQLIAFARVLLADPRILILDEATSSIDTKTEELIQSGLHALLKGRTSFIVAHRLSTIKNSDQIFYIDGGQIVERGNHAELIAQHGQYYRLYQSQYDMLKLND